jgi:hypothetical protein
MYHIETHDATLSRLQFEEIACPTGQHRMSRRLQNRSLRCSLLGAARTVDTGLTMKQDFKVKVTKRAMRRKEDWNA